VVLEELQPGVAWNEVGLARVHHFGSDFIRTIGNHRIQAENVSEIRDLRDDGFAFAGRSGKFCLPGTEYEHTPRLLPFDEEHRTHGINGGRFNVVEALSGSTVRLQNRCSSLTAQLRQLSRIFSP
jgi:hypothetical protein